MSTRPALLLSCISACKHGSVHVRAHARTHADTRTRATRAHVRTHSLTRTYSRAHARTHVHTLARTTLVQCGTYPVQTTPEAPGRTGQPASSLPLLPPTIAQAAAHARAAAGGGSAVGAVDAAAPAAPRPQQPLLPPPRRRLSGAYTIIDPSTLEAIRSGKADDCSDRKGGHRQCARQRNRPAGSSQLYTAYPSKELEEFEHNNPVRRGWFEDLHFGIFAAFDRQNPEAVDFLTNDVKAGGLLDWTDAIAELRRRHGRNGTKIKEDQLVLVEYFLELVCDLFLDPAKCVSNSAGFERFLKEFGGCADGSGEQDDYDVD